MNKILEQGQYGDTPLFDMLADGVWLDSRTIPILNGADSTTAGSESIQVTDLTESMSEHLTASLINYAWIQQNVYLCSFPMTLEECMYL